MIPFNTRQGPSFAQLQALYMNGADDPAFIHGELPSQGRSYIEAGARSMGIPDPVAFFQKQRAMRAMANAPTLPAQLAARDAAGDAGMADERARAVALRGGNVFRTPLPMGGEAELSPLAATDAAERGQTPLNYALANRAREAGVQVGELGQGTSFTSAPTASDLFNDKRFRNLQRSNPDHASKLFNALTGGDLAEHAKTIATNRAASLVRQRNMFDEGFKGGKLRINPKTNQAEQRQMIPDPMGTGKLVESADYGPLDEYHRIGWTPEVQREVLGSDYVDEQARRADLRSRDTDNTSPSPATITHPAATSNYWDKADPTGAPFRGMFDTLTSGASTVERIARAAVNPANLVSPVGAVMSAIPGGEGMLNSVQRTALGAGNVAMAGAHELTSGLPMGIPAVPLEQVGLPPEMSRARAVAPVANQARLHSVMSNPRFQSLAREEQQQIIAQILGQ